jgi:sarcosine oxidase subunit gamma
MSEAVSALMGAKSSGIVDVSEAGLVGMVTIRADLGNAAVRDGLAKAIGLAVPGQRKVAASGALQLLWMSPDELMLVCPNDEAEAKVQAIDAGLKHHHHLAVNVSDARAVFRVSGSDALVREVLAKVTPADLRIAVLPVGEVRRTRLSQVAAAFWFTGEGAATIVCFRSLAGYVFDLLSKVSEPGSEVGHFR